MHNAGVAIESKEPKTLIQENENKSPSKHVAIENKDLKSISSARILGRTYGWKNANHPNTINVLKHAVVGSTKKMHQCGTIIEDCKGKKSKKINDVGMNENKLVATTSQKSINPIGFLENDVLATPNVLNVAMERSEEEGDQKTIELKHKSDAIERADANVEEERLLLKAMRQERKKQKRTNKKKAQTIKIDEDSNYCDSIFVPVHEIGHEGEEFGVEQSKVNPSQQEQEVLNLEPNSEQTTMGIPLSSTLEFSFKNTLVVSCIVGFIGFVLSIFTYNVVKLVKTS